MPNKNIAVTLDSVVSATLIFDSLCAQQANYMKRHKLLELLVPPKCLKHYAKQCAIAYAINLRKCSTAKEHRKLFNALKRRLRIDVPSPEFLRSIHLEYLNLPF